MNFFFDSYAMIEILKDNPNYELFKDTMIFTSSVNLSEVYYSLINRIDQETAKKLINSLNIQILTIDKNFAIRAAEFKLKYKKEKLSYIDCIGYIIAKSLNMRFLTGDEKFRNKENVEFVE